MLLKDDIDGLRLTWLAGQIGWNWRVYKLKAASTMQITINIDGQYFRQPDGFFFSNSTVTDAY